MNLGYDSAFYDHRLGSRLWFLWSLVSARHNLYMLGNTICDYLPYQCACFLLPTILHLTSLPPHVLLGPSRWPLGMVLYMIGYITYGATLVFYAAVFPRLARNTPHSRSLKAKLENEEIQKEEYVFEESMEKNRISNISTVSVLKSFGCG